MQEAKSGTFLEAICTADQWLWLPNGSSVSPSKACSAFNLVAEGILGSSRRYHKSSHILCARTCSRWTFGKKHIPLTADWKNRPTSFPGPAIVGDRRLNGDGGQVRPLGLFAGNRRAEPQGRPVAGLTPRRVGVDPNVTR